MATKQRRPTEAARRHIQRGVSRLANAEMAALDPKEGDVAPGKKFGAPTLAKDDGTVRKMAPPARRYWPSVNSQRAPRRPQGSKRSPR